MNAKPFVLAAAALALACSAFAIETRGSKDEAVKLVKKAVAHYKTAGRDKALADFTAKTGYTDRDIYVFVLDFNGRTVAHGANEKLVGRDMMGLKDTDGKAFIADATTLAKTGKAGWTDYRWINPVTKDVDAKTTYCEPVDDLAVCAGVYK